MIWILILSLASDGYRSGGTAITSMSGFSSYASCAKAGETVSKQHSGSRQQTVDVRWSCVPSK